MTRTQGQIVVPEFGRKSRPEQQALPAVSSTSIKRSSNISLIVMGTLAFTASFAGGSAFLIRQDPQPSQNCTTAVDGTRTCATARSSAGVARYFHYHYWLYPDRTATPASRSAGAASKLVAGAPAAAAPRAVGTTERGGFGASARTVFRGSSAG